MQIVVLPIFLSILLILNHGRYQIRRYPTVKLQKCLMPIRYDTIQHGQKQKQFHF